MLLGSWKPCQTTDQAVKILLNCVQIEFVTSWASAAHLQVVWQVALLNQNGNSYNTWTSVIITTLLATQRSSNAASMFTHPDLSTLLFQAIFPSDRWPYATTKTQLRKGHKGGSTKSCLNGAKQQWAFVGILLLESQSTGGEFVSSNSNYRCSTETLCQKPSLCNCRTWISSSALLLFALCCAVRAQSFAPIWLTTKRIIKTTWKHFLGHCCIPSLKQPLLSGDKQPHCKTSALPLPWS